MQKIPRRVLQRIERVLTGMKAEEAGNYLAFVLQPFADHGNGSAVTQVFACEVVSGYLFLFHNR
jgi:hypothetical protein